MKKTVLVIVLCGLGYIGFGQTAAPKMASSTAGKAHQQSDTPTQKPVMAATSKGNNTKQAPTTGANKPVMANTAKREKPKKKYRAIDADLSF